MEKADESAPAIVQDSPSKVDEGPKLALISWENIEVSVPYTSLKSSQYINNLPDITQEIKLKDLEIDTETLKKVIAFTQIDKELFKVPKGLVKDISLPKELEDVANFFQIMDHEDLLLLTIAAQKLEIELLYDLCTYYIAKIFDAASNEELESEFNMSELTVDEENYLTFSSFPLRKKLSA